MEPEEIRSVLQRAREAWIVGDAPAFAALFATNGELVVPGQRWVGPAAIQQAVAEFASTHTQVKIEIRRILIEGNRACLEWAWQDTETGTGAQNRADDAITVDFNGEGISRWREYIDTETPKQNN